ncbi:hypothetical protein EVA_08924 [gut metagenome]|uniref:Uncharacterized protein n=1 Tax=gut metagenome TaxID=749906 RepID=J9GLB8_9ZZZZ
MFLSCPSLRCRAGSATFINKRTQITRIVDKFIKVNELRKNRNIFLFYAICVLTNTYRDENPKRLVKQFFEVVSRDALVFQSDYILQANNQLVVDSAFYQIVHLVLILHHFCSILFQVFFRNASHTILSELEASSLDCSSLNILVFDLDFVSLNQLFLDQVPLQFFDALSEVVFYVRLFLVRVVGLHDLLQEFFRELELSNLLFHVSANIEEELEVSFSYVLVSQTFLYLVAEFLFAVYNTFTEYLVEEVLIQSSRNEAADFVNLEREVTVVTCNLFLLDLQKRCNFCVAAFVSLARIESDDIVHLSVSEDTLLVVVLEVEWHQRSSFDNDTAFLRLVVFVQFCQDTTEDVAIFVRFNLFRVTAALSELVNLFSNLFVVDFDIVVSDLVFVVQSSCKFWSQCNVEYEYEVILVFDILWFLLFARKGFAQHVDVVFLDVCVKLFAEQFVHFVSLSLSTIHLLYQSCRYLTWTEAWHLSLLADRLDSFLYVLFVVSLNHIHSDHCVYVANFL